MFFTEANGINIEVNIFNLIIKIFSNFKCCLGAFEFVNFIFIS